MRHHRAATGQHQTKLGKSPTIESGSGNTTRLSLPPIDDDQLQFRPRYVSSIESLSDQNCMDTVFHNIVQMCMCAKKLVFQVGI